MQDSPFRSAWIASDGTASYTGAAEARVPWWSFTKLVLSVCALRLAEQKRLDLDARLQDRPYTLRQLLRHEAGVPNYGSLDAYHVAVARGDSPWSRDQLLAAVGERLDFPPGTGWNYSNVGYMFVREAVEDATGLALGAAFEELVLSPLGLESVRLAVGPADFGAMTAFVPESYHPGWVYHGCLVGSPLAAAELLHALFAGRLLGPVSLAWMLERHELGGAIPGRPWTECGYGLGVMSGRMGAAGRALGHSGGGPHSVAAVYHFPDLANPVTVATFAGGTDVGVVEAEAVTIALRAGQ